MLGRLRRQLGRLVGNTEDLTVDHQGILEAGPVAPEGRRMAFCFSTGRAGTRWLTKVLVSHANCSGGCERFPQIEAFYRYCTWYGLPIDQSGFHQLLRQSVWYDWRDGDVSFTASPYFCFGVDDIVRVHAPTDLILMVRRPEAVVASMLSKGWYERMPAWERSQGLCPGVQPEHALAAGRVFGRIFPVDEDTYARWSRMTQVGRISWYCSAVVSAIRSAFGECSGQRKLGLRLEDVDQSYEEYERLCDYFELQPRLPRQRFLSLKGKMSNRGRGDRGYDTWTVTEKREFDDQLQGYREVYEQLQEGEPRVWSSSGKA